MFRHANAVQLDIVYEGSPDFKVLPTMGVIPAFDCMWAHKWQDAVPKFDPVGHLFLVIFDPFESAN